MQLTRFDRWLREKFVHETHIYSLRPPEHVPEKTRVKELPEKPGRRFRFRYIPKNAKATDAIIKSFNEHNQMFTTRVIDRKTPFARFLSRKGKSFTWWTVWVALTIFGVLGLYRLAVTMWNNETLRENIIESIEILKG